MANILKEVWHSFTGKPDAFSMENRAFNATLIISLLLLIIFSILDFLISLTTAGYIALAAALVVVGIYYFARFRRNFSTTVIVFAVCSYALVGSSFLYNSGIDGPIIYLLFATFIMILTVTPRRQHLWWFLVHLLVGSAIFYLHYRFPHYISYTYENREYRFIDHFLCFVTSVLFIYILVNFLRRNYNHERALAQKQAKELRQSNRIIQEQNQELQRINDDKDRLFSIVSHDLRGPVGGIKGMLEMINNEMLDQDERKEVEEDLLSLSNNTFVLLENLLHWSSQKVKGKHQVFRAVALKEVIEETVALLQHSIKAKLLNVELQCHREIQAQGDPEMLRIILRNLLSNAIKFTPEKGSIKIECSQNEHWAAFTVKDSGVGIPEGKQKTLFNDRQVSSAGTENESGAGLGLMLCREYVQEMQGHINFKQ